MSTKGSIGVQGLRTSGNALTFPPSALASVVNGVIPSKDVLEPRRGQMLQSEFAASSDGYIDGDSGDANSNRAREVFQWDDDLLVHYDGNGGGKLAVFTDFDGTPSRALVGSYDEPAESVMRMKFAQLGRSVFWTTSAGLYTLDTPTGTARTAGLKPPVIYMADGVATYTMLTGDVDAAGSWYASNQNVAYRATWGKKDANGRIIESPPCGRVTVQNPANVTVASGGLVRSANVVTATVTSHKFRVGDKVNLTLTGGDIGNFDATNNVITAVTETAIQWAETAGNYTSVADVVILSGTKTVQVRVTPPSGAAAGDFVRLYRTEEIPGQSAEPGDECFLVYERTLTASDLAGVTIADTTPSDFLSDPLDTNANTGQGINEGRNELPPLMRDVCAWDDRLWGAETTDRHRLRLRLLGTDEPGGPYGLQSGDLVAINTRVFEAAVNFHLYYQYLTSENVERTTYSMGTFMSSSLVGIRARHEHDGDTGLGAVVFEQTDLGSTMADGSGGAISAIYAAASRVSAFGDPLAATKAITAASTARVGTTVTVRCTSHGFSVGQVVMLARSVSGSVDANFPVGLKTVASVVDANNFTYTESGSAATLSGGTPYYAYATTYKSDDGKKSLRYSKQGIPEAWPLPFSIGGLPAGVEVLRVAPLGSGDGLLVALKDFGFYVVSGAYPYVVRKLDDTANLLAADTLKQHAGKLHGLTSQGVCTITEAGVGIVGGDVEDTVRKTVRMMLAGNVSLGSAFAVSYESERQYQLWLPLESPTAAGTLANFGAVSQALVLNSMTGDWFTWQARRTCGAVFRGLDVLVLGDGQTNQLRIERKTYDAEHSAYVDERVATSTLASDITAAGDGLWTFAVNTTVSGLAAGWGLYFADDGYYGVVVSVNGATIVARLSGQAESGEAVAFFRPISVSATFHPDTRGHPGIESRWGETQWHLGERHASTITASFRSENGSTGTVSNVDSAYGIGFPRQGVSLERIEVPLECRQASALTVGLSMAEAFGFFKFLGTSKKAEDISGSAGR